MLVLSLRLSALCQKPTEDKVPPGFVNPSLKGVILSPTQDKIVLFLLSCPLLPQFSTMCSLLKLPGISFGPQCLPVLDPKIFHLWKVILFTDGIFSKHLKLDGHHGVGIKNPASRVTNFSFASYEILGVFITSNTSVSLSVE